MAKERVRTLVTFDEVPIGKPFLLDLPAPKQTLLSFKKVSESFAECEDHLESRYYFYADEKVLVTTQKES